MAATVSVKHGTGAATGGLATTNTTITNARLCTADATNDASAHPMVAPSSGTNYGYEAWTYLNADTSPTGTINNLKWYTDGSTAGWTGVTLYVGTASTYVQATGTVGTTGDASVIATTLATGFTSGSPLSPTGSISNPSTGKISQFVVLQARLSASAVAGSLSTETITWRYDET